MEPKKTFKTYQFKNSIAMTTSRRGSMTNAGHAAVEIGSPPEFKGAPDVWCPEELLIGGVNTCLMLTFLAYAKHRRIEVARCESSAEATVENVDGKYRVTRIVVRPAISLHNEDEIPKAAEVLKCAKEDCFISNSVTAAIELAPKFDVTEANALD